MGFSIVEKVLKGVHSLDMSQNQKFISSQFSSKKLALWIGPQDIERRLEAEERKVAEVDAAMKASEDITNDMGRICQSSLSDIKARFHPISNNLWTK